MLLSHPPVISLVKVFFKLVNGLAVDHCTITGKQPDLWIRTRCCDQAGFNLNLTLPCNSRIEAIFSPVCHPSMVLKASYSILSFQLFS